MTGRNEQAPKLLDVPIGLGATAMRQEFDSLGTVEVPADRYWGAQTQRSLQHFNTRAFVNGQPSGGLTRDHILDNITVYWLTGTGATAARSYRENG